MMRNKSWNKYLCLLMMIVGVASLLFGLLSFLIGQPEDHEQNTLLGMFTGFGFGILAVAVYKTIRSRVVSKEKLEQEEIERQDERNIAITRATGLVGYCAAILLLVVLIFLFMGLGYRTPSYICLGALYVLVGVCLIARKILSARM